MQFFKDYYRGLQSYWKALLFVIQHKMYWYAVIPAILMLGIYQCGNWIMHHSFVTDTSTMNGIVWYMIKLLIEISVALLFIEFSKYLVVTLLSPLLSLLSSRTEYLLTGNVYPYNFKQLVWEIKRGIRIVVRNMVWQYLYFVLLFVVCSFFWDNFTDSPLFYTTYIVGFYYYGFTFLDYINERRKLSVEESIIMMRKYRGMTMGIGTIYSLMILVPVNLKYLFDWSGLTSAPIDTVSHFVVHLFLWVMASFAPILATIASTIGLNDLINLKQSQENEYEDVASKNEKNQLLNH